MTGSEYKRERRRRGLSQVALAALVDVRQGTISDRENNRIKITKEADMAIKSLQIPVGAEDENLGKARFQEQKDDAPPTRSNVAEVIQKIQNEESGERPSK